MGKNISIYTHIKYIYSVYMYGKIHMDTGKYTNTWRKTIEVHLRLQRESTCFLEIKWRSRWKKKLRICLGVGEENSGRVSESLENFPWAGSGERRGEELVAHYSMCHLADVPQKHLPFWIGLWERASRRRWTFSRAVFISTIDAFIVMNIKVP